MCLGLILMVLHTTRPCVSLLVRNCNDLRLKLYVCVVSYVIDYRDGSAEPLKSMAMLSTKLCLHAWVFPKL